MNDLTDGDIDHLNDLYGPWEPYEHWNAHEPLSSDIEKEHPLHAEAWKTHDRERKKASRRAPRNKRVKDVIFHDDSSMHDGRRD